MRRCKESPREGRGRADLWKEFPARSPVSGGDPAGTEAFALEVVFDYGRYDLDNLSSPGSNPYVPTREEPQPCEKEEPGSATGA